LCRAGSPAEGSDAQSAREADRHGNEKGSDDRYGRPATMRDRCEAGTGERLGHSQPSFIGSQLCVQTAARLAPAEM
jgi:hypothetical protein